MLNPIITQRAQELAREIAELRALGYADADLDQATEVLTYRSMALLTERKGQGFMSRTDQGTEAETIPTDQIAEPDSDA